MSKPRLIETIACQGFLAKVHRLPDTNEWRVTTYDVGVSGCLAVGTSFHTDKDDAIATATFEQRRYLERRASIMEAVAAMTHRDEIRSAAQQEARDQFTQRQKARTLRRVLKANDIEGDI
jgi:hypothetical protein